MEQKLTILEGEFWWGGVTAQSYLMPFGKDSDYEVDLETVGTNMQINPAFLSNNGRCIFDEHSYKISFKHGEITITSENGVKIVEAGKTLMDAHDYLYKHFYAKDTDKLSDIMFSKPEYCTWVKFFKNQNEKGILEYAQSILDAGLPAGVFIIDGSWQEEFGVWDFHPGRFKDPVGMIEKLKAMGFTVVIWIFPFINACGDVFLNAEKQGVLIKGHDGKPKIIRWWSGYAPAIELLSPEGDAYFKNSLQQIADKYHAEGFKFDGGHMYCYQDCDLYGGAKAEDECRKFPLYGKLYPFCEVRNTFGNGGVRMNFRMADRHHNWNDSFGIKSIVPCIIVMGLMGYPFACPDMLGGGEINNFKKSQNSLSTELFCRFAEASAFMPIIQLSYDFWCQFDERTAAICKSYCKLRTEMSDFFLSIKKECENTDRPIVRSIAYQTNERPDIMDQFFFGSELMVAPVTDEGATGREVYLPAGKWKYYDKEYDGGQTVFINAPIGVLPVFERKDANIGIHNIIRSVMKENGANFDRIFNGE